jgi:hypothetical protein
MYQSKKYIGILNVYIQDATNFQTRIAQVKNPILKVNIEAVAGFINYQNEDHVQNKNYFQGCLLFHIWTPRTNEKIYLTTGLLYSQSLLSDYLCGQKQLRF